MRNSERGRAAALTAVFILTAAAGAQPPDPRPGPRPGEPARFGPVRVGVEDVVERVMAFDKNKDGKVTREELPERMHDLIARGDTNKDGALDRDEIAKQANTRGPGGFGIGGARTGPGPFDVVRAAVDDLKLSGQKKDQSLAVAKAYQENVRKLMDQARADMLQKMKEILSAEEFNDFKAALDRPVREFSFEVGPAGPPRPRGPGEAGPPRPRELEQRLDRIQTELDELRRLLRR